MRDDDLTIHSSSDRGPQPRGPLAILMSPSALRDIWQHADSDTSREIGGVLVGRVVSGPGGTIVEIHKAWPAKHTEASSVHVKFTHETWEEWHSALDNEPDGTSIVGWYHTHPGLGVFLSDHDLFIHRHFFNQPWQVAIVVDPISRDFGCFGWRDDEVVRLPDSAIYTALAHFEAHADQARHPDLQPRQPQSQPLPPQTPPPESVAPAVLARLWWLGWGVALAMFIVAALQALGTGRQLKAQRALQQISTMRGDLIEIRQRLAELQKPPGRWHTVAENETLEDICAKAYGDRSLAPVIAALNAITGQPEPGTTIWLPAPEALIPGPPPENTTPASHAESKSTAGVDVGPKPPSPAAPEASTPADQPAPTPQRSSSGPGP